MRIVESVSVLACFFALTAPLSAADLSRVERKIAREPSYKGRPRYCLLVFGPEARTRVWLVLDGDTLYVDRNGNGDLTEKGEKVLGKKEDLGEDAGLVFEAGDVRDGKLTHKNLRLIVNKLYFALGPNDEELKAYLARHPGAVGYRLSAEVEMPGRKGAGIGGRVEHLLSVRDARGVLKFARRPQDAPIVHLGGPWQVAPFGGQRLTVGRPNDLCVGLGTPGVGPGTTAWVSYEGLVPEKAHATVEIAYPPRRPGEKPLRERYELKHRC
jgi:hypothetical protein